MKSNDTNSGIFDNISSTQPSSGAFFFGQMGVPKGGQKGGVPNLIPPNTDARTLFVGGLTQNISTQAILKTLPNSVNVRRPDGKSFAFVEFNSHASAKAVIDASAKREVAINDRVVTFGWANSNVSSNSNNLSSYGGGTSNHGENYRGTKKEQQQLDLILIPPDDESKTLFIGSLPVVILQVHIIVYRLIVLYFYFLCHSHAL